MKKFLLDVSTLTGATDANPANKVVQLLSDFETKTQEAWRPNNLTRVLCIGVSRKRVMLLFSCTDRAERSSFFGSAARCHERGITHEDCDDRVRSASRGRDHGSCAIDSTAARSAAHRGADFPRPRTSGRGKNSGDGPDHSPGAYRRPNRRCPSGDAKPSADHPDSSEDSGCSTCAVP